MINRSNFVLLAVSLVSVPAIASPLGGSIFEQAEIDMEVRSCLARVGDHANYEGAAQVRHEVTVSPRRSVGHRLDIRTSIYSDDGDNLLRAYTTRCFAYRDNEPVRFRIDAADAGA